jgi:hypothetical protein
MPVESKFLISGGVLIGHISLYHENNSFLEPDHIVQLAADLTLVLADIWIIPPPLKLALFMLSNLLSLIAFLMEDHFFESAAYTAEHMWEEDHNFSLERLKQLGAGNIPQNLGAVMFEENMAMGR